jgi:hypothetical protein
MTNGTVNYVMKVVKLNKCPFFLETRMMFQRHCNLLVLVAAAMASPAFAATDGNLGSTSQGSFTNTFTAPPPPRYVQVLNLTDTIYDNSSSGAELGPVAGEKGGTSLFCVVETTGGAMSATVTSLRPSPQQNYFQARASDGATLSYFFRILNANNQGGVAEGSPQSGSSSFTFSIPGYLVRTSASDCTSLGNNMKKHVGFSTLAADGRTFTDTITITVAPQ